MFTIFYVIKSIYKYKPTHYNYIFAVFKTQGGYKLKFDSCSLMLLHKFFCFFQKHKIPSLALRFKL